MALPQFTLSELLEAGVHFGHRTHRWNPEMRPFLFGERSGIHIIDLNKTVPMFYRALGFVRNTVANNGRVLFVGTKRQAQNAVRESAERCGMFYINHRWLGGTLTNWKTISKSISRLKELERMFSEGAADDEKLAEITKKKEEAEKQGVELTSAETHVQLSTFSRLNKKEKLMLQREYDKLNLVLGGIKDMGGLPDAVVVMDVKREHIAVNEARVLGIPVIGVVDSNASTDNITFPIPGNDDASRAITLYCRLISDAVLDGIESQAAKGGSTPVVNMPTAAKGDEAQRATTVSLSPQAEAAAEKAEEEAKAVAAEKKAAKAAAEEKPEDAKAEQPAKKAANA